MTKFLESVASRRRQAAVISDVPSWIIHQLDANRRIIKVNLRMHWSDGTFENVPAWRVQDNNDIGPYKGGVRFSLNVDESEVCALASLMTLKTSLIGCGFGGGKGAVAVDPKVHTVNDMEVLTRKYTNAFVDVIGPHKDILAPDMGTNAWVMDIISEQYSLLSGKRRYPGVVTGKSLVKGGIKGRTEATGQGAVYALENYARHMGWNRSDVSIAVQGFGNAGFHFAQLAQEIGYRKIVALSDLHGAIYNPNGISVKEADAFRRQSGKLVGMPGTITITNEDLLTLAVDVLVPAALECQIGQHNAGNLRCRTIFEVANGPIDQDADEILKEKEIIVWPDMYVNAGGVDVSETEWTQNLEGKRYTLEEVNQSLENHMREGFEGIMRVCQELGLADDYRMGAHVLAYRRLSSAIESSGKLG